MSYSVQWQKPARSPVEPQGNYRNYKDNLRSDFHQYCGYCGTLDEYCGGKRGFHIDHFAPKSKFSERETDYSNLVYSCPYCNGRKSNTWVTDDPDQSHDGTIGFVDPCHDEYENHLTRHSNGAITHKSSIGDFMVQNLNLGLLRHQMIWQAQKLFRLRDIVNGLIEELGDGDHRTSLLERHREITNRYEEYRKQAFA